MGFLEAEEDSENSDIFAISFPIHKSYEKIGSVMITSKEDIKCLSLFIYWVCKRKMETKVSALIRLKAVGFLWKTVIMSSH